MDYRKVYKVCIFNYIHINNNKMVKEDKKNKDLLLANIIEHPIRIVDEVEEILERKVSKFGNSGHIPIPSKHIGKDARVIIRKTPEEDKKK